MSDWKNPAVLDRPGPFWSWNDKLDEAELGRQIREMAAKGWGSYFMHSRVGLVTGYLSEEWLALVAACAREAERTGTRAWLYDEDKWPSGFAGGLVPLADPAYRGRALLLVPAGKAGAADRVLASFPWNGADYQVVDRVMELGDPWFNGACYVDLMNPAAVRAFLEATHERYREACGEHFGRAIPGVFTDEPCYSFFGQYREPAAPWSAGLPDFFRKRHGYDLLERLPELFFPAGDYRKTRLDFYAAASALFRESFTRQYHQWCRKNNLIFTGHFMAEDTLVSQTQWSGDVMAHYEFMDWPGIDKLGRHISQNVTVKQVSSAAEQLGKERAFCEVYGCMGGQASFFHRKWIGDWQAVLGIGFVNHHLSLYSMRGERKRDYPANLFYQQPWWNDEKEFADYQGRLCRAVTEGKRLVDVLVIQPLTSVWCEYSPVDRGNGWAAASVYDRPFADLTLRLLQEKIDFHYGNESLLAEHGRVEGKKLRLKEYAYATVVVPPALNLNASTLDLLGRFAAAGGFVLFVGRRPELVDGRPGPVEIPSAQLVGSLEEAVELVAARCLDRVTVLDRRTGRSAPAVYVQTRRVGDGLRHLLVNVDEKRAILVSARMPGLAGGAAVLDLSDGRSYRVPAGSDSLEFELAPAGSLLVLTGPEADSAEPVWPDLLGSGVLFRDIPAGKPAVFLGKFECRPQEENVLLLNDFSLELDGRTVYQGPVSGAWHTHFYPAPEGTPFRAVYEFESAVELEGCFAAIEVAENLDRIEFNGVPVKPRKSRGEAGVFSPRHSWKDINFTRVDLPVLRKGLNQLVIAGLKVNNISRSGCHHRVEDWRKHFPTEAEEIYLCGHFSLEKLSEGRYRVFRYRTPAGRNLAAEGYPFYAGRLKYQADFCWRGRYGGGAWLKLNGVSWLASVRVRVNGRDCGTRRWAPWLVDISAALQPGENHLELDAAVTLVNAFGPNRQAGIKQDTGIGPRTFVLGDRFTRDYQLFEFGLENAVIYRK